GQLVHHHLALPPRDRQARSAQRARVVGDQLLVAAHDPSQITHARRPAVRQRDGNRQPRRIAERLGARRPPLHHARRRQPATRPLRLRQVQAQELATIGLYSHTRSILSFACPYVCFFVQRRRLAPPTTLWGNPRGKDPPSGPDQRTAIGPRRPP